MKTIDLLTNLGACDAATVWLTSLPKRTSAKRAWALCERGDWLLWLCGKIKIDRKLLVMSACGCARGALRYVPYGEDRPRAAIKKAEAWCRGEATIDEVRAAASDAATYAVSRDAACAACNAAWAAAWAAYAASYATSYSAWAAAPYAANAANASYDAAHREHADIVRSLVPWRVVREALKQI